MTLENTDRRKATGSILMCGTANEVFYSSYSTTTSSDHRKAASPIKDLLFTFFQ